MTGHSLEGSTVIDAGVTPAGGYVVGKRIAAKVSSLVIVVALIGMAGWKWAALAAIAG